MVMYSISAIVNKRTLKCFNGIQTPWPQVHTSASELTNWAMKPQLREQIILSVLCYLHNESKNWKRLFRLQQDLNPGPLQYRCSATSNWAMKPQLEKQVILSGSIIVQLLRQSL